MSFMGLLAGQFSQRLDQRDQAKEAALAKQADLRSELEMYNAKKGVDAGYAEQDRRRALQEQVEVLRQNRERLESIVSALPEEAQNDPTAIGMAIARSGDTELAKSFLDVSKARAEIGATAALEEQRRAYAHNDTRNTDSQIAERGRSGAAKGPGLLAAGMEGFDPQSTGGKAAADWVATGLFPDIKTAMAAAREDSLIGEALRAVLQNPEVLTMSGPEVARLTRETVQQLGAAASAPAPAAPTNMLDLFPPKR